jgi:N utilization substance protein B
MQSLFAFEQCREANFELAKEQLATRFTADLNSMEVQDKPVLKKEKEAALAAFEKKFDNAEVELTEEPKVLKAVDQSLIDYNNRVKKDFDFLRKSTLLDIENLSGTYYLLLNLLPALASVAAADKRNAFKNFVDNIFIKAISESPELKKESTKSGGHWDNRMDKVRGWFKDIVRIDDEFMKHTDLKNPTYDEQHELLKHVLRKIIMTQTAIKSNGALELQKLSMEWEEDKEFVQKLFDKAVWLPAKHKDLIGQNTINWEVDRLPLTDRVILQLAIAELTQFPNIPVKVTINEYIELTKTYSTPKSKQFINGILDVISKELKKSGEMKKSGRGLIDNK